MKNGAFGFEPTREPMVLGTSDEAEDKANWKRKDAIALHPIHISCGPDAFLAIKYICNAKDAWDTLANWASMAEFEFERVTVALPYDLENIISADEVHKHERLNKAVWKGDCRETSWRVTRDPDVVRARITFSRRTALRMAAMGGHISIVKILVQKMSEQDLEITDKDDMTALAVAFTCNAELGIAECMVRKNFGLLTTEANNMLPVAMAFRSGHAEMGRHLYSITPLSKDYLQTNKEHGARILYGIGKLNRRKIGGSGDHQEFKTSRYKEVTIMDQLPLTIYLEVDKWDQPNKPQPQETMHYSNTSSQPIHSHQDCCMDEESTPLQPLSCEPHLIDQPTPLFQSLPTLPIPHHSSSPPTSPVISPQIDSSSDSISTNSPLPDISSGLFIDLPIP
ncbi:hypothetical protein FEM48_Zijuj03G0043200 [Ziziphus jujuba var. spinosa]|uniref:Uncharacterized protein n=1 Tax=Ziziphus jujuba var. spinosa TaxID=714518 RepID=A0A978VN52_ZIZJJ|nr:hypothetical protein FEM48_Zijuj03G0043200 [Ziziphus jujuba var. spinosa]